MFLFLQYLFLSIIFCIFLKSPFQRQLDILNSEIIEGEFVFNPGIRIQRLSQNVTFIQIRPYDWQVLVYNGEVYMYIPHTMCDEYTQLAYHISKGVLVERCIKKPSSILKYSENPETLFYTFLEIKKHLPKTFNVIDIITFLQNEGIIHISN